MDIFGGWWAAPMLDGATVCGQSAYAVFRVYADERQLDWNDANRLLGVAISDGELVPWEASPAPPDWTVGSNLLGGHLTDIPPPHVRKYPSPTGLRRKVRIGVSQIMRHYHVSLVEARNPIWNSQTRTWQEPHDDEEGHGRFYFDVFDLWTDAKRWIAQKVSENFPDDTHEINSDVGFAIDDNEYVPPDYVQVARRAARRQGD